MHLLWEGANVRKSSNSSGMRSIPLVSFGIAAIVAAIVLIASAERGGAQGGPQKGTIWSLIGTGEMEARDGTPFSFKTYKAANGITVTEAHGDFPSTEKAMAELNFQKAQAKKIVKEEPVRDSHGNALGRRVVAFRRDAESQVVVAEVFWTEGASFYSILSVSLQTVLDWGKGYSHLGKG
jgi:hypothetical protein